MKSLRILSLLFAPCLLLLCLSDTAFGQPTITITDANSNVITPQSGMTFNVASPNSTFSQLTLTSNQATSINFQVTYPAQTPISQIGWLKLCTSGTQSCSTGGGPVNLNAPVGGGSPTANLTVSVATVGLTTGPYQASFTLSTSSGQALVTIPVTLNVNGASVLSSNQPGNQINFTAIQGSNTGSPSSVAVLINSTSGPLSYTVGPPNYNGQALSWLLINPTSGVTNSQNQFSVSVNPTGLQPGTYNASFLVTASTNDQLNINVSLTVSATGSLTVTPANPPPFLYQVGGAQPQPLTITVSAPTTTSFTINTNAFWLVSNSFGGTAGPNGNAQFTLSVQNLTSLQPGTTNATVTLTPTGGGNPQTIPVSIVVSNNPLLSVSPTTLSFQAAFAGSSPADQTVSVTATGSSSALGFSVTSDSTWLSATPSQGVTPATLSVHITQGNLAVATNYVGTLTVRPNNGDNYSINITVNLAVGTSQQQITAGPPVLLFSYQTTKPLPQPQVLTINSSGQQVSFTMTTQVTTCGGSNWLFAQAQQLVTPAQITVSILNSIPTAPATCTGVINVTPSSGNVLQIPVTVIVNTTPLLAISMPFGFGYESVQQGASAGISRSISVTSTDNSTPLQFSVASNTSTGGNWLLTGGGGLTPGTLNVFFQPSGLNPGSYTGNIVITSASLPGGSYTIPVTMVVTPNVNITVSPSSLTFTASQNGPTPASQTLTLANTGGSPGFTATVSQNCQGLIGLDRSSGVATGNVVVSMLSTAGSVGTYNCQITFAYTSSATNSTVVNVTVNINTARTLNITPQSLTFAYQLSQAQPAPQKITLSSVGGAVQFSVGVTSSGWLSADASDGTTPKDINISVNTAGLTVANSPYTGQIRITAPGVLANPVNIPVTLTVTGAPTPQPVTVTSTATNLAGTIAAGELITIKGTLLGPTTAGGVLFSLNATGGVNSTLAGVRVLFDGIPGTPIFVSAGQINVSVPYEVAGRLSTNIVVEYQGIQSAPVGVRVTDSAPGLFTLNSTGSGQAAAVNQNGTFNGPAGGGTIPASLGTTGTTVILYGTGGGQTSPPGQTGSVSPVPQTPAQLMKIPGIVSATVGGVTARVDYAGQAPGLVTGIMQFNLFLFPGTPTGNQSAVITINGISSPLGATVAVSP